MKEIGRIFTFVIAFILGGTGLGILYYASGEIISLVGGFALIGIALAIISKFIKDG